jgi:hypothetical protein
MFEKLSQMAEQAATSVSRRQFLGRFGGAAALACGAAGLLAQTARAGVICDANSWGCAGKRAGSSCSTTKGCKCEPLSATSTTCVCWNRHYGEGCPA